jgi:hypothetical protein
MIRPIRRFGEVAFVVMPIMIKLDFGVEFQERWQKMGRVRSIDQWFGINNGISVDGMDWEVPLSN